MVGKLARVALSFLSIFGGRFRVFEEKFLPFSAFRTRGLGQLDFSGLTFVRKFAIIPATLIFLV